MKRNRVALDIRHPRGEFADQLLRRAARGYLRALGQSGVELSLALVTDREIRRLNRTWRGKDRPTDVLSFPAGEPIPGAVGPALLGDIIISLDTTERAAREYGRTVNAELRRYLAHGLLHLLGHDHHRPDEAREMAALEDGLLRGKGMVSSALGPKAFSRSGA